MKTCRSLKRIERRIAYPYVLKAIMVCRSLKRIERSRNTFLGSAISVLTP